tara:strand:- start:530 stop:769 length:240 start_codon:yes stop_codon:yes gene_type:complete
MSSPRYVIEQRLINILSSIPINTKFTALYLRDLYIDTHGTMSVPTSRQIGRILSLSNMVLSKSSKSESLWVKYQGSEEE